MHTKGICFSGIADIAIATAFEMTEMNLFSRPEKSASNVVSIHHLHKLLRNRETDRESYNIIALSFG